MACGPGLAVGTWRRSLCLTPITSAMFCYVSCVNPVMHHNRLVFLCLRFTFATFDCKKGRCKVKNMATEDTNALAIRWIVEYDCRCMWMKFAQLGSVDGVLNRAGSTYQRQDGLHHRDKKTVGCRMLIAFMCKISDAANEMSSDAATDVTSRQTSLEDAIDLLEDICSCYGVIHERSEVRDLKLCLKQHAVLAPLRKNDHITAKVVFCFRLFTV